MLYNWQKAFSRFLFLCFFCFFVFSFYSFHINFLPLCVWLIPPPDFRDQLSCLQRHSIPRGLFFTSFQVCGVSWLSLVYNHIGAQVEFNYFCGIFLPWNKFNTKGFFLPEKECWWGVIQKKVSAELFICFLLVFIVVLFKHGT